MRPALALVLFAGVAHAHPGARAGEAFTFKFSVGPIESGRARLAVGLPFLRDGRELIAARGQAEAAKWLQLIVRLDDEYRLVFDARKLLPVSIESIERGIRDRRIATTVRPDGRAIDLTVDAKRGAGHARRLLPRLFRDPLSALFALRAARLDDGAKLVLDVLDGLALWRVRADVHRGARVRLDADGEHARSRRAVRVDGELARIDDLGRPIAEPRRHVTVFLSDDDDRLLLSVQGDTDFGRAELQLTSWTAPAKKTSQAAPILDGLER